MSAVYNEQIGPGDKPTVTFRSKARQGRDVPGTLLHKRSIELWHQIVCFDDPSQYLSGKWVEEVAMGLYVFYDTNFIANNDNFYESIILAQVYLTIITWVRVGYEMIFFF